MNKQVVAGYINLTFENGDFVGRRALKMIDAIKSRIPTTDRAYDPDKKLWLIKATEANKQTLREIYNELFVDKNQLNFDL